MTPQELAHWRYQFARLDSLEVDDLREAIPAAQKIGAALFGSVNPAFTDGLEHVVRCLEWLREEARYMCELGELAISWPSVSVGGELGEAGK